MDTAQLRAWWFHRQGLDGSLMGSPVEGVLAKTGWARSVGGANPYLALHARCGRDREEADRAVKELRVHELPSARGCTYILPQAHFAIGLTIGQGYGDEAAVSVATRHLGVTNEEIDRLGDLVCKVLTKGPMDPRQMKPELGDAVRSFGEEGKRRGVTTDLPLALGRLQSKGRIRRISVNGRIDNQRYAYALWDDGPFAKGVLSKDEAFEEFARLYFEWTGGATVKNFQWLSGLGVKASQDVVGGLGLVPLFEGSDLLATEADADAARSFKRPSEPHYALVGSIDNLTHLRLGLIDTVDEEDRTVSVPGDKGLLTVGGISELTSHGIFDRGRLIGVWEYDVEKQEIAWQTWVEKTEALKAAVARTEDFVRKELEDARTFSLDSPESRKPRLAALRGG